MPLTSKGSKILAAMQKTYGGKKGKSVFYASINAGKVKGAEGKQEGGGLGELDPFEKAASVHMRSAKGYRPESGRNYGAEILGAPVNILRGALDTFEAAKGEAAKLGTHEEEDFSAKPSTELALGLAGQGVPLAAKNSLGVFGGLGAKTSDPSALLRAVKAEERGVERGQILKDTDWFRGADKNWRFEIPDAGASLRGERIRGDYKLRDVLDHPKLFEAYPELGETSVQFGNLGRHWGSIDPNTGRISVNNTISKDDQRSTLLHEIQHWIQRNERFSLGANPNSGHIADASWGLVEPFQKHARNFVRRYENAQKEFVDEGMKDFKGTPGSDEFYERQFKLRREFNNPNPQRERDYMDALAMTSQMGAIRRARHMLYKRNAGETESRNVQARRDFSESELKERQPWATQDYPENEQWTTPEDLMRRIRGFADGGPTPPLAPAPMPAGLDPDKMARLMALQRQIMQGRKNFFSPIRGNDVKGNLAEVTAPVTAGRMNPEGWQAFLDQAPESQNIEDRRGLPLTEREALFRSGRDQLREQLTPASGPYDQYVKQATEGGRPNLEMLSKIAASMAGGMNEGGRTPTQEELINAARAMAPEYIKIMERYKPPAPVKKFWGGAMQGQGGNNPFASLMNNPRIAELISRMRGRMGSQQGNNPFASLMQRMQQRMPGQFPQQAQAQLPQQAQAGQFQHPMLSALGLQGQNPFSMFGMGAARPQTPVAPAAPAPTAPAPAAPVPAQPPGQPQGMARGGYTNLSPPWYARHAMKGLSLKSTKGFLNSAVPGRTDRLPLDVAPGSYVVPADIVSALGQGNSMAGAKMLKKMFGAPKMAAGGSVSLSGTPIAQETKMFSGTKMNKYGGGRFRRPGIKGLRREQYEMAEGGEAPQEDVPIIAAGGEFLLSPDEVAVAGRGDVDAGHNVLDAFVKSVRKEHIKTLRNLKSPKKD